MPELPEVESARQVIERSALDRRIVAVDDSDTYVCRPHRPGEIEDALRERRLLAVHRRGKLMWCETSGIRSRRGEGPLLSIHLGMSGRIVVDGPHDAEPDEGGDALPGRPGSASRRDTWSRFALQFADGGQLRLLDPRRLGRIRLDPDLDALGPDAGEIDRGEFRERVGRGTAPVKARLLDQSTLAGVGNLLADEALWQSGLDPRRPARELSPDELDALRRQLRRAIRRAIRHGGVGAGEIVEHRRPDGHCPRCGSELRRATVGSRTTWWCPREQR
ncbi:DNA-formamidopyrimidine glycosylase family protein [Marmoricola sp. URHB0036]|uniref:DNA-formamidopyrimidine glycosylase family protein n=1 Tax=Marmoricola sp. URHB0036 TaxID=1298863 RepID=UPI0004025041|nr:DNA-formamidopyrimidine glycosylase family protein [Marmoricola sp. URHB0036]